MNSREGRKLATSSTWGDFGSGFTEIGPLRPPSGAGGSRILTWYSALADLVTWNQMSANWTFHSKGLKCAVAIKREEWRVERERESEGKFDRFSATASSEIGQFRSSCGDEATRRVSREPSVYEAWISALRINNSKWKSQSLRAQSWFIGTGERI